MTKKEKLFYARYMKLSIEEGLAEGEAKETIRTIISFFKDGLISGENAAKKANMSLEDFRKAEATYCN